jgi:hypothetical protein
VGDRACGLGWHRTQRTARPGCTRPVSFATHMHTFALSLRMTRGDSGFRRLGGSHSGHRSTWPWSSLGFPAHGLAHAGAPGRGPPDGNRGRGSVPVPGKSGTGTGTRTGTLRVPRPRANRGPARGSRPRPRANRGRGRGRGPGSRCPRPAPSCPAHWHSTTATVPTGSSCCSESVLHSIFTPRRPGKSGHCLTLHPGCSPLCAFLGVLVGPG